MTAFAARSPDQVAKLVYLDAAFDRTPEGFLAGLDDPANKPGMVQRMRMEALGMPEASSIVVGNMPPPNEWAILVAIHRALFAARPDYKHVKSPTLSFYAVTANEHYPSHWLPNDATEAVRKKADAWWQKKGHALMREAVEQFRTEAPRGEIIELHDAKHYLFTGDTADEVALKTREFLLR
jgi:pimeloyl-ACP methyl ester carboxylesterase